MSAGINRLYLEMDLRPARTTANRPEILEVAKDYFVAGIRQDLKSSLLYVLTPSADAENFLTPFLAGWQVEVIKPKGPSMEQASHGQDQSVLNRIQELVQEEHRLYEAGEHETLNESDRPKLEKVQIELDQCWDLLRQRRALRGVGEDPDKAQVRPAEVVENYLQ